MKILSKIQDYELTENVIDAGQGRTERWRCRYISAMNTELKTLVKYRPFYLPRCRPDRLWLTFDRDLQVILEGRKEDVRYRLVRYRAAAQLLNRFVTNKNSLAHTMARFTGCDVVLTAYDLCMSVTDPDPIALLQKFPHFHDMHVALQTDAL